MDLSPKGGEECKKYLLTSHLNEAHHSFASTPKKHALTSILQDTLAFVKQQFFWGKTPHHDQLSVLVIYCVEFE